MIAHRRKFLESAAAAGIAALAESGVHERHCDKVVSGARRRLWKLASLVRPAGLEPAGDERSEPAHQFLAVPLVERGRGRGGGRGRPRTRLAHAARPRPRGHGRTPLAAAQGVASRYRVLGTRAAFARPFVCTRPELFRGGFVVINQVTRGGRRKIAENDLRASPHTADLASPYTGHLHSRAPLHARAHDALVS